MTARELDAAGITEPALRAAYTRCRRLNARHGRTYFLATRLLPVGPPPRRARALRLRPLGRRHRRRPRPGRAEHRRAAGARPPGERLARGLRGGDSDRAGRSRRSPTPPPATASTTGTSPTSWRPCAATWTSPTTRPSRNCARYMHGSAAVIGLQMLPVLGTVVPREEAAPHAAALGLAFQLTNFLRDVGEDLDRGRIYLPADLLAAHGVDRELLRWCRRTGRRDRAITQALRGRRGPHPRRLPRGRGPASPCSTPSPGPASARRSCSTAGSWTRSPTTGTRSSTGVPSVPRRRRAAVAARGLAADGAGRACAGHGGAAPREPHGPPPDTAGRRLRHRTRCARRSREPAAPRPPLTLRCRGPWPGSGSGPPGARPGPAVIAARPQAGAGPAVGQLVRLGATRDIRHGRPLGRDGRGTGGGRLARRATAGWSPVPASAPTWARR